MRLVAVLSLALAAPALLMADEIVLKDGSKVSGRILDEGEDQVVIQAASGRRVVSRDSIKNISRDEDVVKVLLKSGKEIEGELTWQSSSSVFLQIGPSQIEIAKINIETIDGKEIVLGRGGMRGALQEKAMPSEVRVPAGSFLMGDSRDDKKIAHKVHLDPYWIDRYEVTNLQYRQFVRATGRAEPEYWEDPRYNDDSQPVVGVTFEDAGAYCGWLNKRLPSEAEWEKAARGGQSRLYPWGDRPEAGLSNTSESKKNRALGSESFPNDVSPYGVRQMAGNVLEWCLDVYDKNYYRTSPSRNPTGPAEGKKRVVRGGAWMFDLVEMSERRALKPETVLPYLGFRCAKGAAEE